MRKILLQDMAVLLDWLKSIEHPIAEAEIFQSEEFKTFRTELLAAVEADESPAHVQIQRVVPLIGDEIRGMKSQLGMRDVDTDIRLNELNSHLVILIAEVSSMKAGLNAMNSSNGGRLSSLEHNIVNVDHALRTIADGFRRAALELDPTSGALDLSILPPLPPSISPNEEIDDGNTAAVEVDEEPQPQTTAVSVTDPLDSHYTMNRSILKVSDVLREFKTGIDGGPSIESLNLRFKSSWRKDSSESQWFARSKFVFDLIVSYASSKCIPLPASAAILDRKSEGMGLSLSSLKAKLQSHKLTLSDFE